MTQSQQFPITIHDARWDASGSPWTDRALAAGARWVKIVDDPASAYALAVTLPDVSVIYRRVAPKDLESLSSWLEHADFPTDDSIASAWVRYTSILSAPNLFIEGHNEPTFRNIDDVLRFARIEARRSVLLDEIGLRAVIGNFATGTPEPGMFRAFMSEYLDRGGRRDALIGVHEYGTIDLAPETDRFNWLGHVRLRDEAGTLAAGFEWVVTECGLDRVMVGGQWAGVAGWKKIIVDGRTLTQSELWAMAARYAAAVRLHGFALCCAWFTYGDTGQWENFEMNDADEFNKNLVDAIRSGAAAQNGSCSDTNAPLDWTHTVDATLGLNVRTTPEIPPATTADPNRKRNVACAMQNGQRVRVTRAIGTWAEIDFPRSGYCNLPNLDARPVPAPAERQLAPAFAMAVGDRFIDVSAYQTPGDMDWSIIQFHEYRLAMIRVAIGLAVDDVWRQHWDRARGYVGRMLYSVFNFTATAARQADIHAAAIESLPQIPTVAIDLETSNPSKSSVGLNQYVDALTARGIPLAWYARASWVADNLTDLSRLAPLPFIVAHYKNPAGTIPAVPPGITANAWQYVGGEKVLAEKMYWGFAKTRSGKFLDESVVMAPGLIVHAA